MELSNASKLVILQIHDAISARELFEELAKLSDQEVEDFALVLGECLVSGQVEEHEAEFDRRRALPKRVRRKRGQ